MKSLLKKILFILTQRVLRRYNPTVIGITGSVGKTTAREAISNLLSRKYTVRKNSKNLNNEFGVPISVLNISQPIGFFGKLRFCGGLIKNTLAAFGLSLSSYPEIVILELGADHPGDIAYLTQMLKPDIAII